MCPATESTEIDVLVVGGGIQGLTLLDELTGRDYATVLVTNDDLGGGQTLHSHGVLNSGYAAPNPAIRESVLDDWLPFAAERGLDTYGDDAFFGVVPPGPYEQLSDAWDAAGYPYERVAPEALPAGFLDGDLFADGEAEEPRVVRIEEYTVPKRVLVRSLADGRTDRIVRGEVSELHVTPADGQVAVDAVHVLVDATGESVELSPAVVAITAGTGTKRLVESVVAESSFAEAASSIGDSRRFEAAIDAQLLAITHERLHMICIRGPREVLPPVNALLAAERTVIVSADVDDAHEQVGGETVTWYVTPQDPAWEHVEDVPDSARAVPEPSVVARGIDAVMRAYPPLRDAATRADSPVEFGVYAGFKQNVEDDRVAPMCERVAGTTNVVLALPTLVGGAWLNARAAADLVAETVEPSCTTPTIEGAGEGVRVGQVRENAADFEWLPWEGFVAAYRSDADA